MSKKVITILSVVFLAVTVYLYLSTSSKNQNLKNEINNVQLDTKKTSSSESSKSSLSSKETTTESKPEEIKSNAVADDNVPSEYDGSGNIATIKTLLTTALTYDNGDDLKNAYKNEKDKLTGSFWSDVYGKLKPQNTPAIDAFANGIDSASKKAEVKTITIVETSENNYTAVVEESMTGDAKQGGITGTNYYHFDIKASDGKYETTLTDVLNTIG